MFNLLHYAIQYCVLPKYHFNILYLEVVGLVWQKVEESVARGVPWNSD